MELIAAGLSSMDLNRWYTFQCYLQTFDGGYEEDSVHIQCIPSQTTSQFFPKLKEVSVYVLPRTSLIFLPSHTVDGVNDDGDKKQCSSLTS